MRLRLSIAIALIFCFRAETSRGAVVLASLSDPTVQTLIGLGSDGVTVGPLRFYDFGFVSSPISSAPSAGGVAVQAVTSNGDGLRFVSAWTATGGTGVTDVITYKVAVSDPAQTITTLSVFSDGTAPATGAGTFVSGSLTARTSGGSVVGRILRTYDDGITSPVDTTNLDADTDFISFGAQSWLSVTDAISVNSGGSGGVAVASTVENTFDPVPVPTPAGSLFIPCVVGFILMRRSRGFELRLR